MFVKIDGSYVNLALVYSIDLNDDDGTATLWFTCAKSASRQFLRKSLRRNNSRPLSND